MDKLTFRTEKDGERLDRFLAQNQRDFTRSGLIKLFDLDRILLNGISGRKNDRLKTGDLVEILGGAQPAPESLIPQDLPLTVIFEDDDVAVIHKPQGMAVHPSSQGETGTLVNALLFRYGEGLSRMGGELRPGIVHRIDKDTSGLVVIAKNDGAHAGLAKQAEEYTMLRQYEGILLGTLKDDAGRVDAPIGRHPVHRTKYCVLSGGRRAVTHYRVLGRYPRHTLAEFTLETGRTHQIRVHMAHLGHPVAGDPLYGTPVKGLRGQCLHAKTLGFTHPKTGERLAFSSDLPLYFEEYLKN